MRWAIILLVVGGCGGVVVVDGAGDDDGSSANGSSQDHSEDAAADATSGSLPGDEAWTPHDGPQCVDDCRAWIDSCAYDRVCVEPDAFCPGSGAERVHDLIACVCAGCAERCGGSCVMFDTDNPECLACQQTMVAQTCSYEYYDCVGQ